MVIAPVNIMPPTSSNSVTNSIGIILPPTIAAIVDDSRKHPEKGHVLSRLCDHSQQLIDESSAGQKKRGPPGNNTCAPIIQNKFICTIPGDVSTIKGYINTTVKNKLTDIECDGHIFSISTVHQYYMVVILSIPERGKVPCLCPRYLIDTSAIKALQASTPYINQSKYRSSTGKTDQRKAVNRNTACSISVTSLPASRGDVVGNLIESGLFKGRVVDDNMLSSINSGCIRQCGPQSFYTVDRRYLINKKTLMNVAQEIIPSPSDGLLRLVPIGRNVNIMVSMGEETVLNQLVYHTSIKNAIGALHQAGNLPSPSLKERLLQISIGGDPDSMAIGKFLPCEGLSDNPNINVRCACGFAVNNIPKSTGLLRRRCQGARK